MIKAETFAASGDLSAQQFHIVNIVGAFVVDLALIRTGYGVLQNKPRAGEAATVAIQGTTKVAAGAAVAVGDLITSAASGWGTAVLSGIVGDKQVLGRAITAAASGSVFSMFIDRMVIVRTGGLPV
jgi:hypothetical protein